MRHFPPFSAILLISPFLDQTQADTIYSNLQNIAIPTGVDGVYLDVDTGTTSSAEFTGWDINPFFGGVAIGNSPAFQAVRAGTGNLDRMLNLIPGSVISGSLKYSSGYGGSGNAGSEHIGAGADQFQVGTDGYLGFKFNTNGSTTPLYGWIRMSLTNNTAGALIKDWGYDNAGGSIVIGRVQQSEASGGTQTVTLSPGIGENFALGSAITNTGGNVNSLLKIGAGTTRLTASNTYTGMTTISAGTLLIAGDAFAASGVLGANANLVIGDFTNKGGSALTDGAFTVGKTITLQDIGSAANTWTLGGNTANASSFNGNITPSSLAYSATLNLSQVTGGTTSFSGIIAPNPNVGFVANVSKVGGGTVILTNANTYDGTTTVTAGILLANNTTGSATGAGAVSVSSGATLGGSGSISGATTISSGGLHTAGTSVTTATPTATLARETFTTGITYDAGSIFEWNLTANEASSVGTRGIDYDAVNTASLASNGALAVFRVVLEGSQNFSENFWNSNRTWGDIFTNIAANSSLNIATVFQSTVEYYNSAGLLSNVAATQGNFTISGSTLSWTPVPEPTSALVGLLITAGMMRRRR